MSDIHILIVSDNRDLNSALANVIEGHVFQWKDKVRIDDPLGNQRTAHMNVDFASLKQKTGERNVTISTIGLQEPSEFKSVSELTNEEVIDLFRRDQLYTKTNP